MISARKNNVLTIGTLPWKASHNQCQVPYYVHVAKCQLQSKIHFRYHLPTTKCQLLLVNVSYLEPLGTHPAKQVYMKLSVIEMSYTWHIAGMAGIPQKALLWAHYGSELLYDSQNKEMCMRLHACSSC